MLKDPKLQENAANEEVMDQIQDMVQPQEVKSNMRSRLEFFESISDIEYPLMLVKFFDHFIALKELVQDYGDTLEVLTSLTLG